MFRPKPIIDFEAALRSAKKSLSEKQAVVMGKAKEAEEVADLADLGDSSLAKLKSGKALISEQKIQQARSTAKTEKGGEIQKVIDAIKAYQQSGESYIGKLSDLEVTLRTGIDASTSKLGKEAFGVYTSVFNLVTERIAVHEAVLNCVEALRKAQTEMEGKLKAEEAKPFDRKTETLHVDTLKEYKQKINVLKGIIATIAMNDLKTPEGIRDANTFVNTAAQNRVVQGKGVAATAVKNVKEALNKDVAHLDAVKPFVEEKQQQTQGNVQQQQYDAQANLTDEAKELLNENKGPPEPHHP